MRDLRTFMPILALVLPALASAGQEEDMHITIAVDDPHSGEVTSVMLDSEDLGFSLDELQVGETRSFIDADGRSVLITRQQQGFKLDVDGKTIELPAIHDAHTATMVSSGVIAHPSATAVRVSQSAGAIHLGEERGIMIFSGDVIDDATKEGIKSLLLSSGYNSDVQFVDASEALGLHKVEILDTDVDVQQ